MLTHQLLLMKETPSYCVAFVAVARVLNKKHATISQTSGFQGEIARFARFCQLPRLTNVNYIQRRADNNLGTCHYLAPRCAEAIKSRIGCLYHIGSIPCRFSLHSRSGGGLLLECGSHSQCKGCSMRARIPNLCHFSVGSDIITVVKRLSVTRGPPRLVYWLVDTSSQSLEHLTHRPDADG